MNRINSEREKCKLSSLTFLIRLALVYETIPKIIQNIRKSSEFGDENFLHCPPFFSKFYVAEVSFVVFFNLDIF